jgi:ABC-2 type transport system ATP-binding protein
MDKDTISLIHLTKRYKTFTAVDDVNLTVNKGEIFGMLGPNGAGKSTTILMMLGLTEPTEGTATICGINPAVDPISVKKLVGYLPEDVGFYDNRTGLENLVYTAQLNRIPEKDALKAAYELLERVGLKDEADKKTGKYSKGMRQRLGLADVLIKQPQIIILDEPTTGIDPQGVRAFLELIAELRDEHGLTVLFSSHNLHQVGQICDRVGIYVKGRMAAVGDICSLSMQLFGDESHNLEEVYNRFFDENKGGKKG